MSTTPKRILYVGYQIDDADLAKKLEPIIGDKIARLRIEIYTVHLFYKESDQSSMLSWYGNGTTGQKIIGYLRSIYIHESKNVLTVVGIINIASGIYYITFVNDSNISLQNVKLFTNRGDFGKPIEIEDKIPIDFKKCIQYQPAYQAPRRK